MKQYLDLLNHIKNNGIEKEDRTGTGTLSTFGYQMRFDLNDGFPLITTKKVFLKGVIHELLWMIAGKTNIKYLTDNDVHIWDAWADSDGNLGPIYGNRWRSWGKPINIIQPKPNLRNGLSATYLDVACGKGKEGTLLKKVWEGMIARCYDKKNMSYPLYGGKGVFVCDAWLEFEQFAIDAEHLAGYNNKKNSSNGFEYQLDKDIIGNGFIYGPEFCSWVSAKENYVPTHKYTVAKDGNIFTFTNIVDFCKIHGCESKNFSDLWTGNKNAKIRNGFTFVSIKKLNPSIDQLLNVIQQIKENPDSRRLIVNSWDVQWIEHMALPPCHCFFQFYVANGKLSCQLYQRSVDAFLGLPFNIASYALLTMMIAQVTNLELGEFIHTSGDLHLYNNHIDQVNLQLTRKIYSLPRILLNPDIKNINDFKYEDFELINYISHPPIKAPVAV